MLFHRRSKITDIEKSTVKSVTNHFLKRLAICYKSSCFATLKKLVNTNFFSVAIFTRLKIVFTKKLVNTIFLVSQKNN